jgi:hypothetical protein
VGARVVAGPLGCDGALQPRVQLGKEAPALHWRLLPTVAVPVVVVAVVVVLVVAAVRVGCCGARGALLLLHILRRHPADAHDAVQDGALVEVEVGRLARPLEEGARDLEDAAGGGRGGRRCVSGGR